MASEGHEVVVYIYDISKGMAKAMSQALLGKYLEENWILCRHDLPDSLNLNSLLVTRQMTLFHHLSPLLKCLMTVCPSSLHSCVQGSNFSSIRTPW